MKTEKTRKQNSPATQVARRIKKTKMELQADILESESRYEILHRAARDTISGMQEEIKSLREELKQQIDYNAELLMRLEKARSLWKAGAFPSQRKAKADKGAA